MNSLGSVSSGGPDLGLRTSKAPLTRKKEAKNHLVKNSDERAEGVGFNMV